MADHRLDRVLDLLTAGPVAGESHEEFRRKIRSLGVELAALMTGVAVIGTQDLGAAATEIKTWRAPYDLQITSIYATKNTSSDTITATLVNRDAAANTDKNPLHGTNVNMHTLATANEAESQSLSATAANLMMHTGDSIMITFATGGGGALTGGSVAINYKPIQPF